MVVLNSKTMKTKVYQVISTKLSIGLLMVSVFVLVGASLLSSGRVVRADSYQTRINALSNENTKSQAAIAQLESQASSYQAIINNLQSQIGVLQASINSNRGLQTKLEQEITTDQAKITEERNLLANDVKTMYVDGTPSTLEILATSKNLSDFIDKQEYRTSVQTKLQDTVQQITILQSQLKTQQQQVRDLISKLQAQQDQLSSDQSQQQFLLNSNKSQQASYVAQVQANDAKIAQIQAERAAAIARISGSYGRSAVGSPIQFKNFWTAYSTCGGGYSYCWAGFNQLVNDPWGLGYAHECVHFVADWLARHGYQVPHFAPGAGNADNWPSYGTIVPASQVQVGDVAYMPLAPVGHVGVVTAINSDGTFHIEQMNWPVGGYYSEMDLYPQNVTFISFPKS